RRHGLHLGDAAALLPEAHLGALHVLRERRRARGAAGRLSRRVTRRWIAVALGIAACGAGPQLSCSARIARLRAEYGLLAPAGQAPWRCADGSELASTFSPTDPPYARFERGGQSVVAPIAPSGSGSRYASPADRFEYWEHQGEATLTWDGRETKCRKP